MQKLVLLILLTSLFSCGKKETSTEGVVSNPVVSNWVKSDLVSLRDELLTKTNTLNFVRPGQRFLETISNEIHLVNDEVACLGEWKTFGIVWLVLGNKLHVRNKAIYRTYATGNPPECNNIIFTSKYKSVWEGGFYRNQIENYIENLRSMDVAEIQKRPNSGVYRVDHRDPYTNPGHIIINTNLNHNFMDFEKVTQITDIQRPNLVKRTTIELLGFSVFSEIFNDLTISEL